LFPWRFLTRTLNVFLFPSYCMLHHHPLILQSNNRPIWCGAQNMKLFIM
jgi:hypothetical protein